MYCYHLLLFSFSFGYQLCSPGLTREHTAQEIYFQSWGKSSNKVSPSAEQLSTGKGEKWSKLHLVGNLALRSLHSRCNHCATESRLSFPINDPAMYSRYSWLALFCLWVIVLNLSHYKKLLYLALFTIFVDACCHSDFSILGGDTKRGKRHKGHALAFPWCSCCIRKGLQKITDGTFQSHLQREWTAPSLMPLSVWPALSVHVKYQHCQKRTGQVNVLFNSFKDLRAFSS